MASGPNSKIIQHLRRAAFLQEGEEMTDGQLLESFLSQRDQAAFAALLRRHGPMVWGVCRRVLRNHQDAEDAFQATFFVFLRKADSIVPQAMLPNWLYGVAYRAALKARALATRRQQRERQVTAVVEPAVPPPDCWADVQPLLDQELSRLPCKYRVPIILCDLEGKTRQEAAQQLGWPEGTVAGRLARARTLLAKRLKRRGLVLSSGVLAVMLSQHSASGGMPTAVEAATLQAATQLLAGQTAGVLAPAVVVLTEGVLRAMWMTKLKIGLSLVLVLAALGLGFGAITYSTHAQGQMSFVGDSERQAGTPKADPAISPLPKVEPTMRMTLPGHTHRVSFLAFSPDGKTLASGGSCDDKGKAVPGEIKLWNVASGRNLLTLQGHRKPFLSLAFSPDGKTLALGSADSTVKLWDVTTGKERATLQGHTEAVGPVAFSPCWPRRPLPKSSCGTWPVGRTRPICGGIPIQSSPWFSVPMVECWPRVGTKR